VTSVKVADRVHIHATPGSKPGLFFAQRGRGWFVDSARRGSGMAAINAKMITPHSLRGRSWPTGPEAPAGRSKANLASPGLLI
jgi:hypothetical protein